MSAERRAPSAERRAPSAERRAPSAERRAPSAERRAPSAERRAPSAERRAPSAERRAPSAISGCSVMRALRRAAAALPAFSRRSRSRHRVRCSEPSLSASRRPSRGGTAFPLFLLRLRLASGPAPRAPSPGRSCSSPSACSPPPRPRRRARSITGPTSHVCPVAHYGGRRDHPPYSIFTLYMTRPLGTP